MTAFASVRIHPDPDGMRVFRSTEPSTEVYMSACVWPVAFEYVNEPTPTPLAYAAMVLELDPKPSTSTGAPAENTVTDGNGADSGQPPTVVVVDACETDADCGGATPHCDTASKDATIPGFSNERLWKAVVYSLLIDPTSNGYIGRSPPTLESYPARATPTSTRSLLAFIRL